VQILCGAPWKVAKLMNLKRKELFAVLMSPGFITVIPNGITGIDLADHLRKGRPSLKVIISSGYTSEKSQPELLKARKVTFIANPMNRHDWQASGACVWFKPANIPPLIRYEHSHCHSRRSSGITSGLALDLGGAA